jgi:hypothetical protein
LVPMAASGQMAIPSCLPNEMSPRCLGCAGTWLVVDGEEVPYTHLFMEVHEQLCSVIVAPGAAGAKGGGGGSVGGAGGAQ